MLFPKDTSSGIAAENLEPRFPIPSNAWLTTPLIEDGSALTIPSFRPLTISPPDSLIFGAAAFIPVFTAPGSAFTTRPTIGTAFLNRNVLAVSTTEPIAPSTSPPLAIKPSRFLTADFMAPKDPLNVVDASLAVVPVTSSFSWITWIALYTSARLSRLYLTPEIFPASFNRRSISDFVPP